MPGRTFHQWMILLSAIMIASIGPQMAGCSAPQLPLPRQEVPATPKTNLQAWNPFIVSDPNGALYLTFAGGLGGEDHRLFFTRSLDGGMTWQPEPVQLTSPVPLRARIGFHRLESNREGGVSVTWSIERQEGNYWRSQEVRHVRSSNGGASWPDAIVKWTFDGGGNFPTAQTGADGSVYLFWTQKTGKGANLRFTRTVKGGADWLAPSTLAPGSHSEALSNDKKTGKLPPPSPEIAWPTLVSDGRDSLYVAWQEGSATGNHIHLNRSPDGGGTWLATAPRLDSLQSSLNTSRFPQIVLDGSGGVYAIWEDDRYNASDLYFNRSLDGGVTWLDQDLRITPDRPLRAHAVSAAVAADRSGRLYVAWLDTRHGQYTVYFNRSLDRGSTWLTRPIRLDHHGEDAFSYSIRLRSDDAGHVYVTWWERSIDGKDTIHFNRSSDYGVIWLDKDLQLDRDGAEKGKEGSRFPWMDADGKGRVYVVWSNDQNGKLDLFLNRSNDHGATWLSKAIRVTR